MSDKDILCQALYWQLGRFVPYEALEDVLWGWDENGGPLDARNIIKQYVFRLRNEGNEIECWGKRGVKMVRRVAPNAAIRLVA